MTIDAPRFAVLAVPRTCDYCGERFELTLANIDDRLGKYCSAACYRGYMADRYQRASMFSAREKLRTPNGKQAPATSDE